MDIRFRNESVFTICGPSSSGKTIFTQKLISNRDEMFKNKVNNIHWFYGEIPPSSSSISATEVQLHRGLEQGWTECIEPYDFVIIDDLFQEGGGNKELTNVFTRIAHHRPCTLIYITQNIFHKSSDSRTRNLNTHYLIIMNNPRDSMQISHISRQMYPANAGFLVNVFKDATRDQPYSYILLDFHQETQSILRIRSKIFPGEDNIVYIEDK